MTERKYSVASIGSSIDGFWTPPSRPAGFKLNYEIAGRRAADDDFETPDVMVKFTRSRRGPAAREPRRTAAGAGARHHGNAAHAVARTTRAFPSTPTITACCGSKSCA